MAVERKYERDVDLLLAEEFTVSSEFAACFLARTGFGARSATVIDVFVSKADSLGESDLIVLWESTAGDRFAIMIEDKIDAPLQPAQAERYRGRADREIAAGTFAEFETVLCAPRSYLAARNDLDGFDHLIALEDVAEMISASGSGPRTEYRATFLRTAAARRANSWVREQDDETDAFWNAAYNIASSEFPILEMKQPQLTKGSTWITLRPSDLPTKPKYIYISLKGHRGEIDLTFESTGAHVFASEINMLLDHDMRIVPASAATAIRIVTEPFKTVEPLAVGIPKAKQAFEASARLIEFYRRNRTELDGAAERATPPLPLLRKKPESRRP